MKEKIQQRINQVKQLATSSSKLGTAKATDSFHTTDSLSKSIRNAKEASVFLAELDAAFKVAQTRK